jgi:hypothetical protein
MLLLCDVLLDRLHQILSKNDAALLLVTQRQRISSRENAFLKERYDTELLRIRVTQRRSARVNSECRLMTWFRATVWDQPLAEKQFLKARNSLLNATCNDMVDRGLELLERTESQGMTVRCENLYAQK